MSALETWMVHSEAGAEGPYTLEQLRIKVEAGRLRPDDKLVSNKDRGACHVVDLFPAAAQIARRTTSERIRRTGSSGRQAAATASQTQVDGAIADLAADRAAAPQVAVKPVTGWHGRRGKRLNLPKPRTLGLLALAIAAALGLATLGHAAWTGMSGPAPAAVPATTALDGRWVVDQAGLESLLAGTGQNPAEAQMLKHLRAVAEGFSLTVGAGQAALATKQRQVAGPVTIDAHPGALVLTWNEGGKPVKEVFTVFNGTVMWQTAVVGIPLKSPP
jgi:hypothetical protein